MKKLLFYVLFIVLTFLVVSCSKTCDCTITTHTNSYEFNFSLNRFKENNIKSCSELSVYMEEDIQDSSQEYVEVKCVDSDRLF